MKGRMIVLDHVGGREAAALLVDGVLQDLMIDDEGNHVLVRFFVRSVTVH